MSAFLDENSQFEGVDGLPVVNGFMYFGVQGADPTIVANQITIYSDRGLTVPLANPQRTGSDGRSVNKIWVPGRYSFQVDDVNSVQIYQDLDAGATAEAGTTNTTNVQGTNALTAEGAAATITAYTDKEIYLLKIANTNTGPVTVALDGLAATAVKRNFDQAILPGQFKQNDIVAFVYNSTTGFFHWINENRRVEPMTSGADIPSASTVDVSGATGNILHITGTTTITAWTMFTDQYMTVIFDGILQLTHHATTNKLITGANITTAAGDMAIYHYDGTTVRMIDYIPLTGIPLKNNLQVFKGSFSWDISTTGTQAITGVGFIPKGVIFMAAEASTFNFASGMADGTNQGGITDQSVFSADSYSPSTTILTVNPVSAKQATLSYTSNDSDGFTVTKAITSTPTGTVTVHFMAIGVI